MSANPTLAVWKFASCDGCQLTLLNCEEELLAVAERVTVAYFPEATRAMVEECRRRMLEPVEGVPSKPDDLTLIVFRTSSP